MWPTIRTDSAPARWPYRSFIDFRRSTSSTSIANGARDAHASREHRRQPRFERAQVVQTGQIVGHRQRAQMLGIVGQLRRGDAGRDEQRDDHRIRLFVAIREQVRVGEVIQHRRGHGGRRAAAPPEPDAGEDDRQVVEVLKRRGAGGAIQPEDQREGGEHDRPGPYPRRRSIDDTAVIRRCPMSG